MKCRIANKKAEMKRNHQVASGTLAYGYRKSEDKTIEVCEPQASYVRELFNLYATKQWSLITLHDHLATKDDSFFKLSSQSSTRACRVSAIIHNTLYSGNNTKNSNVYPPIVARHIVAHYIVTSKGGQLKLTVVTPTNTWSEPIINRFSRKK